MAAFSDRVLSITGASSGIGEALALAVAGQHPRLVLAGRDTARLKDIAGRCRSNGARVLAVTSDLSAQSACQSLIDQAVAEYGTVDVLINNAGQTMWALFEEVSDLALFERLMKVNYLSSVYCTYFALPYLMQNRGRIVAVTSVAGFTGVPTRTAYAASKHAMVGFFESLRVELAGSGTTVTIVAPDFVQSRIHQRALGPGGDPLDSNPMSYSHVMTAERCARMILRATEKRKRLLVTSLRGRFGRWVKLLAPRLIDRIAAHAISRRR